MRLHMNRLLTVLVSGVGLSVFGGSSPVAHAQQIPPNFTPEEIERRVREELDRVPEKTVEYEDLVKITYKPIPTDPKEIIKNNPQLAGQLPPNLNIDAYIKQYEPQIQEYLNKYMRDIATFEALEDLKFRSKRIPKGKYQLGLEFEGARIIGAVISSEDLKKPIAIRFKAGELDPPAKELRIELETDEKEEKKGRQAFRIMVKFNRGQGGAVNSIRKD